MTPTIDASADLSARRVSSTSPTADAIAWTIVRAATGLILMPHGAQKLFGMFGGGGLSGTGQFFEQNLGLYPGILFAAAAGMTEFSERRPPSAQTVVPVR